MATNFMTVSTATNLIVAPALSLDMVAVVMANSIGLLMENAVVAEQNTQQISNASVAQCCALIISAGAAGATKPPKSKPPK